MTAFSTLLLALAMSTDAFAAAIAKGAALQRPDWREALRAGLIFGTIEGLTPVVGWWAGSVAARHVTAWDHWIAFGVLGALGLRMIWASLAAAERLPDERPERHSFWVLAATGFATSIDAMAVGASLAFIDVAIAPVAFAIGLATCTAVTIGVLLGRGLGAVAGRWSEAVGGVVLVGIGSAILYQHLHAG